MNILLKTKIYAFLLAVLLVLPGCGGGGGGGSASSPTLVITAQPHDQNVEAGTAVRLTVVASTAASYQWQTLKEGGWTNIAGSTSADLTLAAVSSADDGKQYRVVITSSVDAAIQVTSSIVTLRVSKDALPPGIAVQPANVTLAVGQRGMLSITATGTSLQYLWQSSVDGSFWVNAGAPSDPTLTLTDASLGDSGKMWRVIVSNSAGYATSAPALVTVISTPAATVTVQPADAGVIAGQRATFAAQVTGVPAPALQWQTSADGGTWSNVAGAVDQGFSTPPTSISDSGHFYRLVATNASGTTTSRAAQLSVTPASQTPLIQTQPASTVVNLPAPATFSVVASATPSGTYQWQLSTDGGMSFINITGATSASYTVNPSSISDNNARYRVSVSNTSGSVVSAAAMLSVQQAPTISVQPRSGTWTGGERVVSFNVTASGSPKPSFQWQVSTDGGMNFSEIPDANLPTYSTYKTDAVRGNLYKVRVSNAAGTVVSNSVRFDKINWVYANPRPTGDHLYSVAWSNASTAVAVGSTRTILRTTDRVAMEHCQRRKLEQPKLLGCGIR